MPAFLFGPWWAAYKRSWFICLVLALVFLAIAWFDSVYVAQSTNLYLLVFTLALYASYVVVCGVYGNRWLAMDLIRRGYSLAADAKA
ncbi:MAG: hypothetical protein EOO74_01755 [Myxococcales bacterium]|nr:MAG: hypothetical protein EOO74_01755 [Myxococcales bacterium]